MSVRKNKKATNFDDNGHILVYDVIYCTKAYDLYKNIPTFKKLSTKQRMRLAETSEKREHFLERLSEVSAELESLSTSIKEPNITGEKVANKLWGVGTVVSCNDGLVEVEFPVGNKKFKYPDSINSFITLSTDKYNEAIEAYRQNLIEIQILTAEQKNITFELEKLY